MHGPALGDLQDGTEALDEVQADHSCRHFRTGDKVAGETAAAEVVEAGLAPDGRVGHLLDVLIRDLPPFLHNSVAVFVRALAAGVEAGCAGVQQMNDAAVLLRLTLQIIAGDALRRLRRPVGTHVGEDLCAVRQQLHEQHAETVEHVVFRCEDHRLLRAFKVEGRVEYSLGIVTVGPVVRPLSLALEAGSDGVVSDGFFNEACGQVFVALDQILDDAVHLDRKFPLLFFFFRGKLDTALFAEEVNIFGVVVAAFLAVLLRPCQRLFIGLMVVDTLFHAAEDLNLVNGLHTQAQILLHEVLIHDGAADAHGDGADLQIALAPHRRNCDSGTAEAQQLFLHVVGDFGDLIAVLHLMAVDAEGGQALLGVGRQNRGQIHSARPLGAVEAPDALDGHGVHVHRLGAVAPAGSDGQCDGDALALELLGAGGRFRHAANGGVSHDDLHMLAVGVVQIILKQLLCGLGHGHDLIFQTLAQLHRAAAAIDNGADADHGIFADITILCHTINSFTFIKYLFYTPFRAGLTDWTASP